MVDLLGVFACGEEDFNGAVGPARRYLRRKLSSSSLGRAALGSKPLLWSLMPADHNVQHLLTRMLVLSPVCRRRRNFVRYEDKRTTSFWSGVPPVELACLEFYKERRLVLSKIQTL